MQADPSGFFFFFCCGGGGGSGGWGVGRGMGGGGSNQFNSVAMFSLFFFPQEAKRIWWRFLLSFHCT